jgi:hypothetical protein
MKRTIRSFSKTRLFIACILLFSLFFVHQSCTKINTDVSGSPALTDAEITQKFFALPANAPLAVRRAAAEMKKRNDANEYIVKFAKENGYPVWNKAIVSYNENAPVTNFSGASSNIAGAEDTTVILPLVPAGIQMVTGFVNATLSDSINLNLYRGGDYSRYTFENQPGTAINADKAALQMMVLSKEVFGYTQFDVNDNRLFSNENQRNLSAHPYRVTIKDTSSSQNLANPCQQYIITVYSETCYSDGYCDLFPLYSFSIWLGNCGTETQTGGGGSGEGGGGGFPIGSGGTGSGPSGDIPPSGGGSGGGTSPYPCPTPQSRNIEALPCNGVPPPPIGPIPTPLANQIIIDSLAGYPCAQSILAAMPNINLQTKTILHDIFGVTDEINLIVYPYNFNDSTIDADSRKDSMGHFRIRLNTFMLNNASKDYIAATIIHEAVHAYIIYMKPVNKGGGGGMDSATFAQTFPIYMQYLGNNAQHNEMAANYVNLMKGTILALNPTLNNYNAEAICWGGLEDTAPWNSRSDTGSIKFRNTVAKYLNRSHFDSTGSPVNYSNFGYKKCP